MTAILLPCHGQLQLHGMAHILLLLFCQYNLIGYNDSTIDTRNKFIDAKWGIINSFIIRWFHMTVSRWFSTIIIRVGHMPYTAWMVTAGLFPENCPYAPCSFRTNLRAVSTFEGNISVCEWYTHRNVNSPVPSHCVYLCVSVDTSLRVLYFLSIGEKPP